MPFSSRKCFSRTGKSGPTTPTILTESNGREPREKYTAEPPSVSSALPEGVVRVSRAMEPTTSNAICLRSGDHILSGASTPRMPRRSLIVLRHAEQSMSLALDTAGSSLSTTRTLW